MVAVLSQIKKDLKALEDREKAKFLQRFFKTGPGEYAEGDAMLGISMPNQRAIAKKYARDISVADAVKLLASKYHEFRMTALVMLVYKYEKSDEDMRREIYDAYLANTKFINNWDLVDVSAPNIVGDYLLERDRKILYRLAKSSDLWKKRIAMLATFAFIKERDFDDALKIAEILIDDEHDLIHKAVGWMLRELGKKSQVAEEKFLKKHYKTMPRTMLRYAIERFDEKKRKFYMGK